MKLPVILCVFLCGCALQQPMLMNNTPYDLDVTISNRLIAVHLPPGHTLTVPCSPWHERTAVAVAAYDSESHYVGANDWLFYGCQDQVWRIDRVNKPQP